MVGMAEYRKRIMIIGAGFSGLATAFELQNRLPDAEITLLETQQRVGGMLWSEAADGYLVEHGPSSFTGNRLGLMKLCKQLGLTDQLITANPNSQKRYILHEGQLEVIPPTLSSALTSPLFGMGSALRLVTERFRSARGGKGKFDESIYHFAERRVGTELAQVIADALATEHYAGDGKAISIRAGYSQVARAEREFGSVLGGWPKLKQAERNAAAKAGIQLASDGSVLYSFPQGMQTIVDVLAQRLKQPALLGVGARSIQHAADGMPHRWLVRCSDDVTRHADIVIFTCPVPKQSAILADIDTELVDTLMTIPLAGVVSLTLGYLRNHVPDIVDSNSLVIPQRYKRDLLRIEFPSSQFPDRSPEDRVLLKITMGGFHRGEMLSWEEDSLIATARRELRNLLRIVKPPQFCRLVRWPRAIPQYTLGHQARVSKIEERLDQHRGLYLGGNAYHGVTLHEAATQAERLARLVRDDVKAPR